MDLRETDRGIEVTTPTYRLLLEKAGGYAAREVEIHEAGRLDRFDRPEWLRAMRSSAGVFLPLTVGIGDSFGDDLIRSWRRMKEMDRGAGVWMEMLGEKCSVMAVLVSPSPITLEAGGMKYWDGPDDADEGEGVSHGCINLDVINCEVSGASPLEIDELSFSYRVFLSGPTVLRTQHP
jgi:hypothetical protein